MIIPHISVSRHGCWKLCKAQYKFRYHLKVITDVEEPFYFIYGNIIHKIAELYVAANGEKPISEVASDILKGIIPYKDNKKAPPLPAEYRKKFPEHVTNIVKITEKTGFGGYLEHKFELDLDPPNKRILTGFIDRLIKINGKFLIIDYKTTKQGWWRKTGKEIADDLQLRCYARVVQKQFGAKAEDIRAALYYLDGGELAAANFSQESLDRAEEDLLKTFIEIEKSNPDEVWGSVGEHCKRCDYRKICPHYSLT